ncbi:hypothetical protein BN6_60630 [Saccharothrix espanaensis DSM 44229]|uniref:HTH arsR-type domain-containing protein n=1 Tax=Saccharothrix espanaensis (strain ATCC 51144 / DSM 44229 / JCM 9112 / NBRC 15066 / NRRL 15764) TaxID=1179773 RepID=K0K6Z8_SACES|nr:hypothetical protein BN6_60630 [Saccharothrix espanaensis DSM 44229]
MVRGSAMKSTIRREGPPDDAVLAGRPAGAQRGDARGGALKALAHPRRQQMLDELHRGGPATSAALARALDLNTGATSYHLRELARHGFVEELPERARGRERWWRAVPADIRFPRRGEQGAEVRALLVGMDERGFAEDVAAFHRARSAAPDDGAWGDAFPYSRGTVTVSLERFEAFFEEYLALLAK